MEMSSEEIKRAIGEKAGSLPSYEDDEEISASDQEGEVQEVEEEAEEVQRPLTAQQYADRAWQEKQQEEAEEAREAAQEQQEQILNYLEGRVKESGGEEQFSANFQNAQVSDFLDLRDKYFKVAPLVDAFATEYSRGQIKISPESMQNLDNVHEDAFWKWVHNPKIQRKYGVSLKHIEDIIRSAAEGSPLRSKSKELMFPGFTHPVPKKGGR